jgi:hypothetical protein
MAPIGNNQTILPQLSDMFLNNGIFRGGIQTGLVSIRGGKQAGLTVK